jgi:hypothetical protein
MCTGLTTDPTKHGIISSRLQPLSGHVTEQSLAMCWDLAIFAGAVHRLWAIGLRVANEMTIKFVVTSARLRWFRWEVCDTLRGGWIHIFDSNALRNSPRTASATKPYL